MEEPQAESEPTSTRDRNDSLVDIMKNGAEQVGRILEPGLPELPPKKAKEIGNDWLAEIRRDHSLCRDRSRTETTRKLAHDLIRAAGKKPADYTVTVVEDEVVNAYAFVGNNIVVNTGFLDFAGRDTEMIQFVLAHEIGHLVEGHVDLPFRRKMLTEGLAEIGELADDTLSGLLKNSPYNQVHEEVADCFAVKLMRSIGASTDGGVRFFRKLSLQESDDADGEDRPFATLFDSHPDHHRRIELISGGCSD